MDGMKRDEMGWNGLVGCMVYYRAVFTSRHFMPNGLDGVLRTSHLLY